MIKNTKTLQDELGEQIKRLRLRKDVDQLTLAGQANISVTALKNLEQGKGASLKTFIKTLRVLDQTDWLSTLAPEVSISPMQLLKKKGERKRASRRVEGAHV